MQPLNTNPLPIGISDSGVGGLSVLRSLIYHFPNESFIYFGDSARAPYGNKSPEELLSINNEMIDFFNKQQIKLLIIACNTTCSTVLDSLKKRATVPIIELIKPTVQAAIQESVNKKIVLLATQTTITHQGYSRHFNANPSIQLLEIPCVDLVPIAESNQIHTPKSTDACQKYLDQASHFKADTYIYGCSHYPFFKSVFQPLSPHVHWIDPAVCIVPLVSQQLKQLGLNTQHEPSSIHFWISGDLNKFKDFISFNMKLDLENYSFFCF